MKRIYSAQVTPLTDNYELDAESLEKMLERNISHGIKGFFALGSMGEGNLFDIEFSKNYLRECSRIIKKRAELLAGINANGLKPALDMMKDISELEFDSYVVIFPPKPFSYSPMSFIEKILDSADRPVYYYHCPPRNGIELNSWDFEKFISHPKLKGIKNSSGNMALRKELTALKEKYEFILFEGHEWAIDEALMIGCDGALCGMASLGSNVMVKIAEAVTERNYTEAMDLQHKLVKIFRGVYGQNLETIALGQKYALQKMGIIKNHKCLIQEEKALTDQRKYEIEKTIEEYSDLLK